MSIVGLVMALGLGTSCADINALFGRGEVKVKFAVKMEGEDGSRSFSDGKSANQLIFAVYEANSKELRELRREDIRFADDLTATVETKLVKGKSYDFVFWAQVEGQQVFNTENMRAIEINYNELTKVCNNENLDAFYNVVNNCHVDGAVEMNVDLKRPFAQINFATTKADWAAAQKSGIGDESVVKTQITINGCVFGVLNTRDGSVSGRLEEPLEFTFTTIPNKDNTWLPNVDALDADGNPGQDGVNEDYRWLGMTYVLVDASQMATSVELDVQSPTVNANIPVANVPMKRNYRTNLVGNLLTSGAVFNVSVKPIYVADYNVPSTIEEELLMAAAASGEVTLRDDVELTKRLDVTADMVINLNGKTISMNAPDKKDYNILFNVINGATLTIRGEGNVQALGGHSVDMAVYANSGNAIIEGGNFYGVGKEGDGCDLIYARNGKIAISGGTFKIDHISPTAFDKPQYSLLNVSGGTVDNAKEYITVTGGTFYKFGPANNVSEGEGTSFVADGYHTIADGDAYVVVAD